MIPPEIPGIDLDELERRSHQESVVTVPLADGWEWLTMYAKGDGSEDARRRGFPKYHHIHRRLIQQRNNSSRVGESRHYERPA